MERTDRDEQYWGPERASYDDELDAWRERTARPMVMLLPDFVWPEPSARRLGGEVVHAAVGDFELRVEAA